MLRQASFVFSSPIKEKIYRPSVQQQKNEMQEKGREKARKTLRTNCVEYTAKRRCHLGSPKLFLER